MPIYEYRCADCNTLFEEIRSILSADNPIKCESCRSVNTRRILSPFFTHNSRGTNNKGVSSCTSCSGGNCSTCN